MSRYVDIEPLDVVGTKGVSKDYVDGMAYVLDLLDNLPSADVVPVRHSAWKEVLAGMDYEYECTRCKACIEQEYPYCPNCGAKMDGWEEPVAEDFDYWEESGAADAYADHQR